MGYSRKYGNRVKNRSSIKGLSLWLSVAVTMILICLAAIFYNNKEYDGSRVDTRIDKKRNARIVEVNDRVQRNRDLGMKKSVSSETQYEDRPGPWAAKARRLFGNDGYQKTRVPSSHKKSLPKINAEQHRSRVEAVVSRKSQKRVVPTMRVGGYEWENLENGYRVQKFAGLHFGAQDYYDNPNGDLGVLIRKNPDGNLCAVRSLSGSVKFEDGCLGFDEAYLGYAPKSKQLCNIYMNKHFESDQISEATQMAMNVIEGLQNDLPVDDKSANQAKEWLLRVSDGLTPGVYSGGHWNYGIGSENTMIGMGLAVYGDGKVAVSLKIEDKALESVAEIESQEILQEMINKHGEDAVLEKVEQCYSVSRDW